MALSVEEYKKIIMGLVLALLGVGGISGSGIWRVDKFGITDAQLMHTEIKYEMEYLEFRIRRDMPPEKTRQRILEIEHCLKENCTNFKPTRGW